MPIFGYFATSMFFLAGIGVFRILCFPLIDISPMLLDLCTIVNIPWHLLLFVTLPFSTLRGGNTICAIPAVITGICIVGIIIGWLTPRLYRKFNIYGLLPMLVLIWGVLGGIAIIFIYIGVIAVGIFIFSLGSIHWFIGKFRNYDLINFGIYKYTRHPQYLGYIIWSYGLLGISFLGGPPRGGFVPPPSLFWVVGTFIVIVVALQEEIRLIKKYGDRYRNYRAKVPFLLPLPHFVRKYLAILHMKFIKKIYPENTEDIFCILALYFVILVTFSIPFGL